MGSQLVGGTRLRLCTSYSLCVMLITDVRSSVNTFSHILMSRYHLHHHILNFRSGGSLRRGDCETCILLISVSPADKGHRLVEILFQREKLESVVWGLWTNLSTVLVRFLFFFFLFFFLFCSSFSEVVGASGAATATHASS